MAAFDPASSAFAADPYPVYAELRAHSPVHYLESVQWWWVTRYRDVVQALGDRRFGKVEPRPVDGTGAAAAGRTPPAATGSAPPPAYRRLTEMPPHMLESDPPTHTRLRALVSRAFTPAVVESLRPRVAELAAAAVARMAEMGEADLVRDFAFPIPVTIIAELLGVPAEDQDRFREWSNTFVRALDVTQQRIPGVREAGMAAAAALIEYLEALVAERRTRPRSDLISGLVAAHETTDRLSLGEIVATAQLLLVAGHETTTGLLGGGALSLLRHPDQLAAVLERPEGWPVAVEELLRYESPVQRFNRFVLDDVELGGRVLRRGERLSLVFASANRDPDAFEDPDRLDLGRTPNRHVAFGGGIHYCLGAPLARLEAQVAFPALLPYVEWVGEPVWRPGAVLRGLQALPVRVRRPTP